MVCDYEIFRSSILSLSFGFLSESYSALKKHCSVCFHGCVRLKPGALSSHKHLLLLLCLKTQMECLEQPLSDFAELCRMSLLAPLLWPELRNDDNTLLISSSRLSCISSVPCDLHCLLARWTRLQHKPGQGNGRFLCIFMAFATLPCC